VCEMISREQALDAQKFSKFSCTYNTYKQGAHPPSTHPSIHTMIA